MFVKENPDRKKKPPQNSASNPIDYLRTMYFVVREGEVWEGGFLCQEIPFATSRWMNNYQTVISEQ